MRNATILRRHDKLAYLLERGKCAVMILIAFSRAIIVLVKHFHDFIVKRILLREHIEI